MAFRCAESGTENGRKASSLSTRNGPAKSWNQSLPNPNRLLVEGAECIQVSEPFLAFLTLPCLALPHYEYSYMTLLHSNIVPQVSTSHDHPRAMPLNATCPPVPYRTSDPKFLSSSTPVERDERLLQRTNKPRPLLLKFLQPPPFLFLPADFGDIYDTILPDTLTPHLFFLPRALSLFSRPKLNFACVLPPVPFPTGCLGVLCTDRALVYLPRCQPLVPRCTMYTTLPKRLRCDWIRHTAVIGGAGTAGTDFPSGFTHIFLLLLLHHRNPPSLPPGQLSNHPR
ncbi:uncharacterized protein CLUP02_15418 [Colletotrichum lupini]|uniref:Uncharacterized protein n=1 Tax=Colletotrichum lupini TaxID=145971 RepID=A0A9Q8WNZ9_9PEZI|nr:uncharacterized protein CLUP02_15418 [Colletotrichum lupini]UQC89887.1 hypothetical protein CLUP02_15418 [Colletotrichum lupini]